MKVWDLRIPYSSLGSIKNFRIKPGQQVVWCRNRDTWVEVMVVDPISGHGGSVTTFKAVDIHRSLNLPPDVHVAGAEAQNYRQRVLCRLVAADTVSLPDALTRRLDLSVVER